MNVPRSPAGNALALTARERLLLVYRLTPPKPLSLRELGKIMDISRERVRQLEADLLDALREGLLTEFPMLGQPDESRTHTTEKHHVQLQARPPPHSASR